MEQAIGLLSDITYAAELIPFHFCGGDTKNRVKRKP